MIPDVVADVGPVRWESRSLGFEPQASTMRAWFPLMAPVPLVGFREIPRVLVLVQLRVA